MPLNSLSENRLPDISLSERQHVHETVILFDGVCNLCNNSVNFVIDHDKAGKFKFSALQSAEATPYLDKCKRFDRAAESLLGSILLIEENRCYDKSTAALRIAKQLDGLWPVLYGFIIIPKFMRDAVYNWIAQNRYKWFGQLDACRLPTPELRQRFLDGLQGTN